MAQMNIFDWTDEQWDEYEETTVSVPLELLDRVKTGLSNRLTRKDLERGWAETLEKLRAIVDEAEAQIDARGGKSDG